MEILDYIVQYGVYPVLMAALIIVFIFTGKNNKKNANSSSDETSTKEDIASLR
jgi:hypothetical protein